MVTVIAVYWLTTGQPMLPEPAALVAPPIPPPAEPPIVAANEPRHPPVVQRPSRTPVVQSRRRDVRAAVPSPPAEATARTFVGSLQIDSTPRGARVFIDRTAVGVTPLVVTDLAAGSHVIRLEAEGHTSWTSAIRVIADRQTDVRATLGRSLGSTSTQR